MLKSDWQPHMNIGAQKLTFQVTAPERIVNALRSLMHLQEVLKMSSMKFSTCLDTLYH
jgi:hypothetical protein